MKCGCHNLAMVAIAITLSMAVLACQQPLGPDLMAGDGTVEVASRGLSVEKPVYDPATVEGIYAPVRAVWYKMANQRWARVEGFEAGSSYNLLTLKGGTDPDTADFVLPAGAYEQLRIVLGSTGSARPPLRQQNIVVRFQDGSEAPVKIPSALVSGLKSEGGFTIPADTPAVINVEIDVESALHPLGNTGKFLLKPVFGVSVDVVDVPVGSMVSGTVQVTADISVTVYAYAGGQWSDDELSQSFPNALFASAPYYEEEGLYFFEIGPLQNDIYDFVAVAVTPRGAVQHVAVPGVVVSGDTHVDFVFP